MPKCSKKAGIWLPKSAKKREKCFVIRSAEIPNLNGFAPGFKAGNTVRLLPDKIKENGHD